MDRIISENIDLYSPENDEMSDSITQNWTNQALECYYINCDCSKCSLSRGNYSFICQMPKVIDILLKSVGAPDDRMSA